MTDTTTTRAQFKACLANEAARRRIGINVSDAEALSILASDALTDQWYEWWTRRPASSAPVALSTANTWSPAVSAPPQQYAAPTAAGSPVSIVFGVVSTAAMPASLVVGQVLSGIATSLIWRAPEAAVGLAVFGYIVVIIMAGAGVVFGGMGLHQSLTAGKWRPRRATAITLSSVGLAISAVGTLVWLAVAVYSFTAYGGF